MGTFSNKTNPNFLNNLPSACCNYNKLAEEYIVALLNKYDSSKYAEIDKYMLEVFEQTWYKQVKAIVVLAKGE